MPQDDMKIDLAPPTAVPMFYDPTEDDKNVSPEAAEAARKVLDDPFLVKGDSVMPCSIRTPHTSKLPRRAAAVVRHHLLSSSPPVAGLQAQNHLAHRGDASA